ncbi:NUDIX domain-containing protein [Streptomyces antibioticus]|uniref:NUDIX domain-containing protein n=1 Tax=Streptomyces antibioticus TaxID=1890 RepID=UPI0033A55664
MARESTVAPPYVSGTCDRWLVDELIERVDERDRVLGVVRRDWAIRHGWLHRVAVTVCRDRDGRILVHQRSRHVPRFPGCYEVAVGGAVAVGESYEEAARRELGEEMGVGAARVRCVLRFLNRSGLSPHWLAVHETVVPDSLAPSAEEVAWHGWLEESELFAFMRRRAFTPDSRPMLDRYLRVKASTPPSQATLTKPI